MGIKAKVTFINTDEYPTKAKRPKNSRLSKRKLIDEEYNYLPNWKDALRIFLTEL